MVIQTQHCRRQYWHARLQGIVHSQVGEGRTEKEAIGDLIVQLFEAGNVHGLELIRMRKSQFAHLPAGK